MLHLFRGRMIQMLHSTKLCTCHEIVWLIGTILGSGFWYWVVLFIILGCAFWYWVVLFDSGLCFFLYILFQYSHGLNCYHVAVWLLLFAFIDQSNFCVIKQSFILVTRKVSITVRMIIIHYVSGKIYLIWKLSL